MPGESSTFGVTAAVVAQYIGGTPFSTNTVPTEATVLAFIGRVSAQLSGVIEYRGVDVSAVAADTTSQLHLLCQEWVAKRVAMDVLLSRERAVTPLAERWEAQTTATMDEIKRRSAALLDYQPTEPGNPGMLDSHVSLASQVRENLRNQPLGQRLAWGNKL